MYLGFVGSDALEITTGGYHRVCIDNITWAMLPGDLQDVFAVFINLETIIFPRMDDVVGVIPALFKEIDAGSPMFVLDSSLMVVPSGYQPSFHRGKVKFDMNHDCTKAIT